MRARIRKLEITFKTCHNKVYHCPLEPTLLYHDITLKNKNKKKNENTNRKSRETDRQTDRDRDRDRETETETETERQNSKTLFYKDCSLGSVKILTTSPC